MRDEIDFAIFSINKLFLELLLLGKGKLSGKPRVNMKVLYIFLASILIANAEHHLEQRLSGTWSLKSCSCLDSAAVSCSALFYPSYDIYTDLVGKTWKAESSTTPGPNVTGNSFTFVIDDAGTTHLDAMPYKCSGVLSDEIICVNTTSDVTACTAVFECISGDCIGTVYQQQFRSIVYPVIGSFAAVAWFGFPFAPRDTSYTVAMVLAVTEGIIALTMLASPLVYVPLLVMAASVITFHVNFKKENNISNFIVVAALSAWIFLMLGGLNYLSNGNDNIPFFESLVATFNSRECYLTFGAPLTDPRCREYILYCAFMSFVLTVIQPFIILASWMSWK